MSNEGPDQTMETYGVSEVEEKVARANTELVLPTWGGATYLGLARVHNMAQQGRSTGCRQLTPALCELQIATPHTTALLETGWVSNQFRPANCCYM